MRCRVLLEPNGFKGQDRPSRQVALLKVVPADFGHARDRFRDRRPEAAAEAKGLSTRRSGSLLAQSRCRQRFVSPPLLPACQKRDGMRSLRMSGEEFTPPSTSRLSLSMNMVRTS